MSSFFFSSRRRHTRYWRDWSSDVCSSDLLYFVQTKVAAADKFSKEFVATDAFGFQVQCARGEAAQALRDVASSRQLPEIHAIQFRRNVIGRPRQELRVYFCMHFATSPFRL